MLKNGVGTIYTCDRCKCDIHAKTEHKYTVEFTRTKIGKSGFERIKKYDLCARCFKVYLKSKDTILKQGKENT